MTAYLKSHDAAVRAGQASEAATTPVHVGETCSRGGGSPVSDVLAYALSTELVDDDEPTRPLVRPTFFGIPCAQPPYPADQRLPDPRVASGITKTMRQTPMRGRR